jgi:hypothetical protein
LAEREYLIADHGVEICRASIEDSSRRESGVFVRRDKIVVTLLSTGKAKRHKKANDKNNDNDNSNAHPISDIE